MQDVELFLSLAEIAGVFVGFGALAAIRGSGTNDVYEVAGIGMVAWTGIQVVVAALVPVVISRFGVTGHELWLACSLVALALMWPVSELVDRISPERRAFKAAWPLKARARMEIMGAFLWVPMNVALVLVVLGVVPEQEPALYFAAVAFLLFMDAFALLTMVMSLGRTQVASGVVTLSPTPGSND
jgi:hypothetical protein